MSELSLSKQSDAELIAFLAEHQETVKSYNLADKTIKQRAKEHGNIETILASVELSTRSITNKSKQLEYLLALIKNSLPDEYIKFLDLSQLGTFNDESIVASIKFKK
jgi:hypothetical protein